MPKLLLILFTLPLLCCGKDKNQQATQVQTTQAEEICDSLCENEKIKAEYQKRFGVPISDFELSVSEVTFRNSRHGTYLTSVTKTTKGALVEYMRHGRWLKPMDLSQEEWLDFINVLYKSRVNEWQKEYDRLEVTGGFGSEEGIGAFLRESEQRYSIWRWRLEISSDKDTISSLGYYLHPQGWDEFIKIMDDIEERVRENDEHAMTKMSYIKERAK